MNSNLAQNVGVARRSRPRKRGRLLPLPAAACLLPSARAPRNPPDTLLFYEENGRKRGEVATCFDVCLVFKEQTSVTADKERI